MSDLIGKTVGQYQIVEQIGQGGMATIFKAYQPSIDRYVAIKILPRQFAQDPNFVKRFVQEAKAIATLEHPHILPVHDFGTEGDLNYMVMRYVKGGTLTSLMGMEIPLEKIANYVGSVAKALDYAHSRGVVHRDIKPSNILIDEHGEALLTDFGIAKIVEGTQSTQLTADGSVLGTPAYMSPEQAKNEKIDGRSDIYSLGVVLYELLTGQPPYQAETPFAIVIKHINDPLPPPRQIKPDVPESFERVVLKSMAKAPDQRFQTAGDMAQALQTALLEAGNTTVMPTATPVDHAAKTSPDIPAPAPPPKKSSNAPLFIGGAIVAVILCMIVGAVGLFVLAGAADDSGQSAGQGQASSSVNFGADDEDNTANDDTPAVENQPEENVGELDAANTPVEETPELPEDNYDEAPADVDEDASAFLDREILFQDDFDSNVSSWYTGLDEDEYGEYEAVIEDGYYKIWMTAETEDGNFSWVEPAPANFTDFVLTAEIPYLEFDGIFGYGVAFRSTPDGAYFFEIDDFGYTVTLAPEEGDWVDLIEYTEASVINPTGPNSITVEAIGPEMTFFINGEEVATVTDDTLDRGSIGIITDLFETESEMYVEFDSITVLPIH